VIAPDDVNFAGVLPFDSKVWLASQTSKTITMSGKNALLKTRFTDLSAQGSRYGFSQRAC
jgi:hypothetical protein